MKKIVLPWLLPLMLLLALSAQAAEQPRDYIFKGMPDYKLSDQTRNFERLEIWTPKPESTEHIKTTYEGNRVHTRYDYGGAEGSTPSPLQITRYYKAGVAKLGGEILSGEGYVVTRLFRTQRQAILYGSEMLLLRVRVRSDHS